MAIPSGNYSVKLFSLNKTSRPTCNCTVSIYLITATFSAGQVFTFGKMLTTLLMWNTENEHNEWMNTNKYKIMLSSPIHFHYYYNMSTCFPFVFFSIGLLLQPLWQKKCFSAFSNLHLWIILSQIFISEAFYNRILTDVGRRYTWNIANLSLATCGGIPSSIGPACNNPVQSILKKLLHINKYANQTPNIYKCYL